MPNFSSYSESNSLIFYPFALWVQNQLCLNVHLTTKYYKLNPSISQIYTSPPPFPFIFLLIICGMYTCTVNYDTTISDFNIMTSIVSIDFKGKL
ncbi:hypothetical protein L2E82_34962 [Cichorium intybus]|uniref:Uncharacterized protein n=1 Tax=Cichorium intybus TaxID=13427 RepID=A0ACB9BN54_CICIN|nr:hypothetical protein L2E82_34962 [Cichorium intybus]